MSIGFGEQHPPRPPRETSRHARAIVRQHPHGPELLVMVGQDIGWSRLYRDHEDSRALGEMAEGCRLDFERFGW